jgi:hypothetical protein
MAIKTCLICTSQFEAVTSEKTCKDCKSAYRSIYEREWRYTRGNRRVEKLLSEKQELVQREKDALIERLKAADKQTGR